jgi:hypothetical protein
MHELGHNLGLHHAGQDPGPSFMPQYFSVMDYQYVYTGVQTSTTSGYAAGGGVGTAAPPMTPSAQRLDYSSNVLNTINECDLNETAGVQSATGDTDITTWFGPSSGHGFGPSSGSVDWNLDSTVDEADTLGCGVPTDCPSTTTFDVCGSATPATYGCDTAGGGKCRFTCATSADCPCGYVCSTPGTLCPLNPENTPCPSQPSAGFCRIAIDLNGDSCYGSLNRPYNDWLHGGCTAATDCPVNRVLSNALGSSTNESCVADTAHGAGKLCRPMTLAYQCMPWGYADGPPPPQALIQNEISPIIAAEHHTLFPPLTVDILVRPGCGIPWIAQGKTGSIPVGILGSAALDVTQIDPASLTLDGDPSSSAAVGDVNGDPYPDLIAQFPQSAIKISNKATFVTLTGALTSSQTITGQGTVVQVPQIGPDVTVRTVAL